MKLPSRHSSSKNVIANLQRQIQTLERGVSTNSASVFGTGCHAIDALLPSRGIQQGSLVEWLEEGDASGASTVSLIAGCRVCPEGRPLVMIDTCHNFFPRCLPLFGFNLSQLLLVQPASEREALWACEQALRCPAVGLVWANIDRLSSTSFRRLQLAAESAAGIGFLVRSGKAQSQPSWAEVRLKVQPRPSHRGSPCYRVQIASCLRRNNFSTAEILIDSLSGTLHENDISTNPVPLVPRMDIATDYGRSTGA